MTKAYNELNLVVSKEVTSDSIVENSYLTDDLMIESGELIIKIIDGKVIKLNIVNWNWADKLEVLS